MSYDRFFNQKTLLYLVVGAVICILPGFGCHKKTEEKAQDKLVEKAIEDAAKKDGKDVKVNVDSKKGSVSYESKANGENIKVNIDGDKVSAQGTTADNKPMSYSAQNGSFTMKQGNMQMSSGAGATLPDDFPKDFPVYKGSTITMSMADKDQHSFTVTAETKDAMQKVADSYKKELTANGWKEEQSISQAAGAPMTILSYTKGDRNAMITLSTENDKTTLSFVISPK